MEKIEDPKNQKADTKRDEQQRHRPPRQPWMLPLSPVLAITESGATECPASEITGELAGWKAYGLACLPQEWTPAFFLVTSSCLRAPGIAPKLTEWIAQALAQKQIPQDQQVIVRSSGTAETMIHRGRLHSQVCKTGAALSTIRELAARATEFRDG